MHSGQCGNCYANRPRSGTSTRAMILDMSLCWPPQSWLVRVSRQRITNLLKQNSYSHYFSFGTNSNRHRYGSLSFATICSAYTAAMYTNKPVAHECKHTHETHSDFIHSGSQDIFRMPIGDSRVSRSSTNACANSAQRTEYIEYIYI